MIKHLACIMDGNRRWAKKRGWLPWLGHREGIAAARRTIEFCLEKGIPFLSLYTFSIENFKRSKKELDFLFNILIKEVRKDLDEFIEKGVRLRFIGDRELFPKKVLFVCEEMEEKTAHLSALNLNLLFCYGARQEILNSIKTILHKIKAGIIAEKDISEHNFQEYLWTHGTPEPEIIIRTGGVKRLSNFLLYQAAYSELYFLDCLWPELSKQHLQDAITSFNNCQRNFGT